jgi:hypothetical protein
MYVITTADDGVLGRAAGAPRGGASLRPPWIAATATAAAATAAAASIVCLSGCDATVCLADASGRNMVGGRFAWQRTKRTTSRGFRQRRGRRVSHDQGWAPSTSWWSKTRCCRTKTRCCSAASMRRSPRSMRRSPRSRRRSARSRSRTARSRSRSARRCGSSARSCPRPMYARHAPPALLRYARHAAATPCRCHAVDRPLSSAQPGAA